MAALAAQERIRGFASPHCEQRRIAGCYHSDGSRECSAAAVKERTVRVVLVPWHLSSLQVELVTWRVLVFRLVLILNPIPVQGCRGAVLVPPLAASRTGYPEGIKGCCRCGGIRERAPLAKECEWRERNCEQLHCTVCSLLESGQYRKQSLGFPCLLAYLLQTLERARHTA